MAVNQDQYQAPNAASTPRLWHPINRSFLESIPPGYYILHSKDDYNGESISQHTNKIPQSSATDAGNGNAKNGEPEPMYMNFLKNSIDRKLKAYNQLMECKDKDTERPRKELLENLNEMVNMGFDFYTPVHVDKPTPVKQIMKQEEIAMPILRQIHNPLATRPRNPMLAPRNVEKPLVNYYNNPAHTETQLKVSGHPLVQLNLEGPQQVQTQLQQHQQLPSPHQGHAHVQQQCQASQQFKQKVNTPYQRHTQVQNQLTRTPRLGRIQDQLQVQQQQFHAPRLHQVHVQQQPDHGQDQVLQQFVATQQVQMQQRLQTPLQAQQQEGYRIIARELQTQTRFTNYSASVRTASTTQVFIYTVAPRSTMATVAPRPTMATRGRGLGGQRKSTPNVANLK